MIINRLLGIAALLVLFHIFALIKFFSVYTFLYVTYSLLLFFMAFVFMSKGRLVTEKLKAIVSALALGMLLSILILAFLEKSWFMAVLAIIMYWLLSGIGQTLTLWALSRTEAISAFAKIVTILYFLFTLYILLFAKIVRI